MRVESAAAVSQTAGGENIDKGNVVSVPAPTPEAINALHRKAIESAALAVEFAIACGELLIAKKSELKHGEFYPWIAAHCEFKQSTASRYMKAATLKAQGRIVSSLRSVFDQPHQISTTVEKSSALAETHEPAPKPLAGSGRAWSQRLRWWRGLHHKDSDYRLAFMRAMRMRSDGHIAEEKVGETIREWLEDLHTDDPERALKQRRKAQDYIDADDGHGRGKL